MDNLFSQTDPSFTKNQATLYADGGSRGNPGPSGAGAVLYDEDQNEIDRVGVSTGIATNNVAEYTGVIEGMKMALKHNITHLEIKLDSKLVVEQLSGRWKVKHPDMKILAQQGFDLKTQFRECTLIHIPREQNGVADSIANQVMDRMH